MKKIKEQDAVATQIHVFLLKIPISKILPVIIAALPTKEHGTETLEHVFELAQQVVLNFTAYEFFKILRRVMHRDKILRTGDFEIKKEKFSATEILSRNARNDTNFLNQSLYDIITCTYPFEEILQEELLWCLSCMKYPSNDISANHVKILSEKVLKCSKFIKCLKERTLEWIEEKSRNDRAYKVVLNDQRISAIKTIFYIENDDELFKFWRQIFMNKKIVKTEDLSDLKLNEYFMASESLYDLKFPFSLYFMKQIDTFKRYYKEEIALLQQDEDRVDSATNELYDWVIEDHLKDFKNNIFSSIPQLRDSPLERFPELYFNDFITTIAANDRGSKNTKMLTTILKLLIALMAPRTIQNIEIRGTGIIGRSFEKYLVKEITKLMFQRISGNFEGAANAHFIDRWQHNVIKVLSLSSKITRAKNLPDLQLLHIVNDLVASKSIPLDNIKDIIQLGLSSDKQEILSENFVNTVFDKLNKLE
ncbi:hypothetical protein C1646_774713 [Rhizophagus diaphanus]|nr:hypothetical protein C1646_774713 [Rhizophagus diaphanus] [Rhizophagus sp. MUCL 43196]